MSKEIETGGSAFPSTGWDETGKYPGHFLGMTLRDYFIAHIGDENQAGDDSDFSDHVKSALVGRPVPSYSQDGPMAVLQFEAEFRAKWRVMRADAMLEARKS